MRAGVAAIFLLLATAAVAADDHVAAEQAARRRLAAQPGDLDARFALGRALNYQQRHEAALAEFRRLLKARPGNADYLLAAAQAELWRGAPVRALPLVRRARANAPCYEDVWRVQIQALLALGDPDRMRQARLVRDLARQRFPQGDWRFAQLDGAPPPVAAVPPALTPALPTPVSPTAPAIPVVPAVPAVAAEAAIPPIVAAAPPATAALTNRVAMELAVGQERLTRGLPDWRSQSLVGEWRRSDGHMLYGGWRETERYALRDGELHVGGVLALTAGTRIQAEAGVSDTHRVLARHYASLQLQHDPAPGWALVAGWRRSDYDTGRSRVWSAGVDRYLGAERFGYTLYQGGPEGSGLSPSHRLQWAHYYGERDWVGLTLVSGRETEYISSGVFRSARVSGTALSGRHALGADWALSWELGSQRQGDFYTRSGFRLGLRRTF